MPRNPYSASKAGADRLAYSYWATYDVPVIVTRASNNYGPYQFPEKIIPLFVTHALDGIPLPLYGDGLNVRDWLHVDDHCRAVDVLIERGAPGETYNVGGGNEVPNIELTRRILGLLGKPETLIRRVADRPGHDRRYSLGCERLRGLGWSPQVPFDQGLRARVEWYPPNEARGRARRARGTTRRARCARTCWGCCTCWRRSGRERRRPGSSRSAARTSTASSGRTRCRCARTPPSGPHRRTR